MAKQTFRISNQNRNAFVVIVFIAFHGADGKDVNHNGPLFNMTRKLKGQFKSIYLYIYLDDMRQPTNFIAIIRRARLFDGHEK